MTKGKNYNRIVFLTTLSVYLGLVLVGATPQVTAQQTKIVSQRTEIIRNQFGSRNQIGEDDCSELSIGEVIELLAKYDIKLAPVELSYKEDFQESPVKLEIFKAEGNKLFINSLRKNIACTINRVNAIEAAELRDKSQGKFADFSIRGFFPYLNAFYNYKANAKEINADITYTLLSAEYAKSVVDRIQQNLDKQNRKATPNTMSENRLASAIFNNTTIRYENNQVFIVTRLPRAGIDSLLK